MIITSLSSKMKNIFFIILSGLFFLAPPALSAEEKITDSNYDAIISLIRNSKYNEALKLIDETIKENEDEHYETKYEALVLKALALKEKDDCKSAIELLTELESIIQIDPNIYLLRGQCWLKVGKFQYAQKDFSRVIELDPNSEKAFFFRARCREKTGQLDLAIEDYTRLIEINPHVTPYGKRALLWRKKGQMQKARLDLARVHKLVSEDSYGYYDSARILHNMGNYRDAMQGYKKSIELEPINSYALNGLALLYATSEDEDFRDGAEAMKLARTALNILENHMNYATLAASYAEVGNFQEAIRLQNKAIIIAKERKDTESISNYQTILKSYSLNKPWRGNPPISSNEWESLFSILEDH